jgi:hypothetical protein
MMRHARLLAASWLVWAGAAVAFAAEGRPPAEELSVSRYPSIQEAITANPGRMIYVPPGDYEIVEKIRIRTDRSGLFGPGRIVQTDADVPIVEIERAEGVQLRDLTLSRREGSMDTRAEAVLAIACRNLLLENLQVVDNRTQSAAIALRECRYCQIRNCLVENYMRISIDDRTGSEDWGYAFNCINGTGIAVTASQATRIQGNRIVENNLLPTPEIKQKCDLGKFVKRNSEKGAIVSQQTWDRQSVDNWHQGSAILISSPEATDYTQVLDNYIENAAQGIDVHADHVIISQNIVHNAFMGMKAMHGSRNVLVLGNQFSKNDLWSIGLMPGAASHAASADQKANGDGGSIIANNIISEFGYGRAAWIWGGGNCCPIRLDNGQKPENPPLADVIVQGNVVYDSGRDEVGADGRSAPPRYRYAVFVHPGPGGPCGLHFFGNILHAGSEGVSNVELPP